MLLLVRRDDGLPLGLRKWRRTAAPAAASRHRTRGGGGGGASVAGTGGVAGPDAEPGADGAIRGGRVSGGRAGRAAREGAAAHRVPRGGGRGAGRGDGDGNPVVIVIVVGEGHSMS